MAVWKTTLNSISELEFKFIRIENSNKLLFHIIEHTLNNRIYVNKILLPKLRGGSDHQTSRRAKGVRKMRSKNTAKRDI